MKMHNTGNYGRVVDVEPTENPRQLLIDLSLLIAQPRSNDCTNIDRLKGRGLPEELSFHNIKRASNKDVNYALYNKSDQDRQIAERAEGLFCHKLPICLRIMALPSLCANQEECANHAPVLERWTLQITPCLNKKPVQNETDVFLNGETLMRAVRSHLHFSHLSSFFTKCRGKSPIATVCKVTMPGEANTFCTKATTTNPKCNFKTKDLLTEKHMFKPCLFDNSFILNITVECAPRSFLLDAVSCQCLKDNEETILIKDDSHDLDEPSSYCDNKIGSDSKTTGLKNHFSSSIFSKYDDQPSSSSSKSTFDDQNDFSMINSTFFVQSTKAGNDKCAFLPRTSTNKPQDFSALNQLFDANLLKIPANSKLADARNDFDDQAACSNLKRPSSIAASNSSKKESFTDVRFFFPEDDDEDLQTSSRAVTPTSIKPILDDYWPSWATSNGYSPDEVSLSDWSPRTPSPQPVDDSLLIDSMKKINFLDKAEAKCRRALFNVNNTPIMKTRESDDSTCLDAKQPNVLPRDQNAPHFESGYTEKIIVQNLKHKVEGSNNKNAIKETPRNPFVPSIFNRKTPKYADKSNVVLRFNKRTGLPLSSSPAPMTRNRSSFDFDSSLTAVSAIKRSLQCYDHESGGSSDSDSGGGVPLCKSAPACTNLLGNFEESALNGRIKPFGTIDGFTLELGASGSFWPSHVTIPVTTLFFNISDDNAPSPYFGHCSLESIGKKGYYTPKKGIIQATLFNPQGTVVKMFIVRYDLSDMPAYCQTFVRQRTFFMPSSSTLEDAMRNRSWLRYLIHLRFATSKSGKLYLHTDIRMLFSRKSEMDAYNDYGNGKNNNAEDVVNNLAALETYELRSFTEMPKNPKFSPRKFANNNINLTSNVEKSRKNR